jgi:hypothetical protein
MLFPQFKRIAAIACFCDNTHVVLPTNHRSQAFDYHGVIVGNEYSDRVRVRRPAPSWLVDFHETMWGIIRFCDQFRLRDDCALCHR